MKNKLFLTFLIMATCFLLSAATLSGIAFDAHVHANEDDAAAFSINPIIIVNRIVSLRDKILKAAELHSQKKEEHRQTLYHTIKPNESGQIMIHMFHNFVPVYEGKDKKNTITLDNFERFLQFLYDNNYRPISMQDYLSGDIDLEEGHSPFLLTFDDGWASQFSFIIDEYGNMTVNPECAVYIMQEFAKTHPGFETKGVFYVNLGGSFFGNVGTASERFDYLLGLGFEIGNHTYNHKNLAKSTDEADILYEIGRNHQSYTQLTDYKYEFAKSFSLPYGNTSQKFFECFLQGTFEDTTYAYENVVLASGGPARPIYHENYNPYKVPRLLAPGIESIYWDSDWWLLNINRNKLYISDGNPQTVTVPLHLKEDILEDKLNGKQLVTYELIDDE